LHHSRALKTAENKLRLLENTPIDFTIHVGKDQVDAVANEIAQIQAGRKTKVEKEPLPVK